MFHVCFIKVLFSRILPLKASVLIQKIIFLEISICTFYLFDHRLHFNWLTFNSLFTKIKLDVLRFEKQTGQFCFEMLHV
jgi:hypothetical protein